MNPALQQTAFERITDALASRGSRIETLRPGDVMAQCPAHPDGRPSLHVTDGDDRALVWCFAACDTDDIMGALAMTRDDLFNSERTDYDYRDATGKSLRTVTRTPGKTIRQSGQTKGIAVLYRLPEITRAVREGATIYLVEGEPDVHALVRRGYEATTAPAGAKNLDKADLSPLSGANVVAVVDRDEGGDAWAGLVRSLVRPLAQTVKFMRAKAGKDVSDHIAAGHDVADLETYRFPDSMLGRVKWGSWLDAQTFPDLQWVIPDLMPEGFGLLTGASKSGKTWLALALALSAAAGGKALGRIPLGQPKPVLLLALEDSDRRMQSRARQLLVDEAIPEQFAYVTEADLMESSDGRPSAYRMMAEFIEEYAHAHPIVILDTLGKVMPDAKAGENQYQRDYRIGTAMKRLAGDGVTVVAIHHTRKPSSGGKEVDWMDSTSGTTGLNGAADWTLNLSRKRNTPNGLIRVTGRDVEEGEYAVLHSRGSWYLDGTTLAEAAEAAEEQRDGRGSTANASVVLEKVNTLDGVTGTALAQMLGLDPQAVSRTLTSLYASDQIGRSPSGMWVPLEKATVAGEAVCFRHNAPVSGAAGCPDCAMEV